MKMVKQALLRASSAVSLRVRKVPALPAYGKASTAQNSSALFLTYTGKDRRQEGLNSAQEGWKPYLFWTDLRSKLKLCINSR